MKLDQRHPLLASGLCYDAIRFRLAGSKNVRKKKDVKGHTFSIRVPEKVRFGLDLVARRHHMQVSTVVLKGIHKVFDEEGLSVREDGDLKTLLDRLWSPDPVTRLVNVASLAPELLADEDQAVLDLIMRSPVFFTNGEAQDVDDMPLRGGFVRGENVGVCWGSLLQVARGETPAPDWNAEIDAHHAHVATGSPAPGWSSPDDF